MKSALHYSALAVIALCVELIAAPSAHAGANEETTPFVGIRHIHRATTVPRLLDVNVVEIGRVMQRHRAVNWRFNAADYFAASKNEYALKGEPVSPQWDAELGDVMARVGRCVHDENVLATLLADLRQEI